jgi:hypothetical protein
LNFSQIKDDFIEFRDGVAADVAHAVSGAEDKVRVHAVQAGSLIVDLHVMRDVCGTKKSVMQAAADLKAQVDDPRSLLRAGKYTAYTKSVYYEEEVHHQEEKEDEKKMNQVNGQQQGSPHSSRTSSASVDHHEHCIFLAGITSKPHLNGEEVVVLQTVSGKKHRVQVVGTQLTFIVHQRHLVMDKGERWDGLQYEYVRNLINISRSQERLRAADDLALDSSDEDDDDSPAKLGVSAEFVRSPDFPPTKSSKESPRLRAERGTNDCGSTSSEPHTPTELIPVGAPIVGMDTSVQEQVALNSRRLSRLESLIQVSASHMIALVSTHIVCVCLCVCVCVCATTALLF